MRISKPVDIEDISQVLAKGGCAICAFLRNEQSALLRGGLRPDEITGICNFHAWALAAAVDIENTARTFLALLRRGNERDTNSCTFCSRLLEHEVVQLKDLIAQMNRGLVAAWMRQQGTLCQMHADHLRQLAPLKLHKMIDEIVGRTAQELETQLEDVLRRCAGGKGSGGGVLGRAAEFLVSQRGINH
jgi:hypothetical protein